MRGIYPKYGLSIFGQTTRSGVVVECNGAVFSQRIIRQGKAHIYCFIYLEPKLCRNTFEVQPQENTINKL